jgi:hypothetical protein
MSSKQALIIKTPNRKRWGGLWLATTCVGALLMWNRGAKTSGSEILLIVAILLGLMALHRLLSYSVTTFLPGPTPKASQITCNFGLFSSTRELVFDDIEIMRRDKVLPYCQLYLFSSLDLIKKTANKVEIEKYESGQKHLPGLIIVDNVTKKECDAYVKAIWSLYDLEAEKNKDLDSV